MFPRWVKQAEQLPLSLVGSREDLANSYDTPQGFVSLKTVIEV